ncbi:hypothetical protein [Endozoicomonas sp. ALB091]|uniref:hypothetical protein n=1 Tax=Endozoicomonas sp. ALB091 TaxID=3403073 RepID=UPI003BB53EC5
MANDIRNVLHTFNDVFFNQRLDEVMDYFVFDDDLNIVSKQSYGHAAIPKFVRGVAPR